MRLQTWTALIVLSLPLYSWPQPEAGKVFLPHARFDTQGRVLQPGDRVEINVLTLPELERSYLIRADGTFFHPFAGEVAAAGKTLKQLETILKGRFSKELRSPAFRIGLTAMADAEASVLGEVRAQGKMKFMPGATVLELLAQAGGVTEKADLDTAVLLRAGKEIPLNLGPGSQTELAKTQIQNGDILYVSRGKRVGVSGEVQTKGVFAIGSRSQNSVEDAIKNAGGANETAALNRIQIIRPSLAQPIVVNLLDPAAARTIVLEDGDTVLVPARNAVVLGAVGKQGPLPISGKATLVDVVSQAGVSQGNLDAVIVVRAADVIAGTDKKEVYDLVNSLSEGQATVNVPIQDGDLVYVPPIEPGSGLMSGGGIVTMLMIARSLLSF